MNRLTEYEYLYLEMYRQGLKKLPVESDDIVILINSQRELQYPNIPPISYIDILIEELPFQTTLVMQSFNWNFFKGKKYHHQKAVSQTGLLSELFRREDGVIKSPHPVYTYIAKGPAAKDVCQHKGSTCWGLDTPLQKLIEKNALWVNLGRDFPYGIQLLHMAEELNNVPYRFFKNFSGIVDFGSGEREYSTQFFARPRDLDLKYSWDCATKLLHKRNQVFSCSNFPLTSVRSQDVMNACNQCLESNPLCFLENPQDFESALKEGIIWK